jgi:hypothetical protein
VDARVCIPVARLVSAALLALAISTSSVSVLAQGPSLAALRAGVSRAQSSDTIAPRVAPSGNTGQRVVLSVVGMTVGALGGAALAVKVLPPTQCGDDPGLCEAVPGFVFGSVLGAAVGAALPRGTGACRFRQLAPRALLGSSLGYLFGAAVSGDALSGILLGGPIGAVAGGVVGAQRCRAS